MHIETPSSSYNNIINVKGIRSMVLRNINTVTYLTNIDRFAVGSSSSFYPLFPLSILRPLPILAYITS